MKSKTFIILLIVCCITAAAAYMVISKNGESSSKTRQGELLIKDFPVGSIYGITITSTDGKVELAQKDNGWVVANRFDYPSNFTKINELVEKIAGLKIGHIFKSTDDAKKRLSLFPPDEKDRENEDKGVRLVFSDKEGKPIYDLMLGKERQTENNISGNYVMLSGDENVYLVNKYFKYLENKPSDWLLDNIVNIDAEKIKKIVVSKPGAQEIIYTLSRPEKDKDFVFEGLPEGKEADTANIGKVMRALSSFNLSDVASKETPLDKTGFDKNPVFEFYLYDGSVYKVIKGNAVEGEEGSIYLKLEARFEIPENAEIEVTDINDEKKTDKSASENNDEAKVKEQDNPDSPEKVKTRIENENNKFSGWIFIISGNDADQFITDADSFIKKEEENKEKQ